MSMKINKLIPISNLSNVHKGISIEWLEINHIEFRMKIAW